MPGNSKADYVRHAPTGDPGHKCHWPGCLHPVKPAIFMCRSHWYRLPERIRTAIWRAYTPGQEQTKTPSDQYVKAAQEAFAWILENYPNG